MESIGVGCARASTVNNFDDALKALDKVGLPAIIRPSFTLGAKVAVLLITGQSLNQSLLQAFACLQSLKC